MPVRWLLLVANEVLFWLLLAALVVTRYWMGRQRASIAILVAIVLQHVGLLAVGVVDFLHSGHLETFHLVVAAVLVYVAIWGREDLHKVDRWLTRLAGRWRGAPAEHSSTPAPDRDRDAGGPPT